MSLSAPTLNKGLELTAYSVRSCLAPASSRSSGLALALVARVVALRADYTAPEIKPEVTIDP